MNCFIVLSALCIALFVSPVKLEQRIGEPVCDLLNDPNTEHLVTECVEQNSAVFIPDIKECYEEVFNKPGTINDYISKFCEDDKAYELMECDEGKENPPGINDDDVDRLVKKTEDCWVEKWKSSGGSISSKELEEIIEDLVD